MGFNERDMVKEHKSMPCYRPSEQTPLTATEPKSLILAIENSLKASSIMQVIVDQSKNDMDDCAPFIARVIAESVVAWLKTEE